MNLGQILQEACLRNLSEPIKTKLNPISYQEWEDDGKFKIELLSTDHKEAYIHCELPNLGNEQERNYLRMYFLSMCFNAAIYGMKKQKQFKKR